MSMQIRGEWYRGGGFVGGVTTALHHYKAGLLDVKVVHKAIELSPGIFPTRFVLMETAASYLQQQLDHCQVYLFRNAEIKPDMITTFTKLDAERLIEDRSFKVDYNTLMHHKTKGGERAEQAGVVITEGGITASTLEDHVGNDFVLLSLNNLPILDPDFVEEWGERSSRLAFVLLQREKDFVLKDRSLIDGFLCGDPRYHRSEYFLPNNRMYACMGALGECFPSGNTEAIVIRENSQEP